MVNEKPVSPSERKGKVKDYSHVKDEYIEYFLPLSKGLEDLNLSVDCSNGMSNLVIKEILANNKNVHYIYDTFDGTFPTHEPNPLEEKNCRALEKEVIKNKSDVGGIYDGDADRVIFVDDRGEWVQPDYVTAVLGYYYGKKGRKGNALCDIRTSKSTTDYLEKNGWKCTLWKVGHAFAKIKIREIKGIFGGELAGHYYFQDFGNCDSGVLASLLVLHVVEDLKKEGRKLSDLLSEIVTYANSRETNFKLENKDGAIKALYEKYAPNALRVMDFDGYRIEYSDWWFNVRKSNTEPYLRIVAEAKDPEVLKEKMEKISSIIHQFE